MNKHALIFLLALELGSALFHFQSWMGNAVVIALILAVFIASLQSLEVGLSAALLELMIGSHGHMIDLAHPVISIRIGIFAAVMLAWFIQIIRTRKLPRIPWRYGVIALVVVFGVIRAFMLGRDHGLIIADANAFAYLLLVFPVMTVAPKLDLRRVLAVFSAGLAWLAAKTFAILYVYTHFGTPVVRALYVWVRDTRVAEVTRVVGRMYRVFLPSQMWLVPAILLLVVLLVKSDRRRLAAWSLVPLFAGLIISMSRSFALGLAVALIILLIAFIRERQPARALARSVGVSVLSMVGAIAFVTLIINFPIPLQRDFLSLDDLLRDRYGRLDDAAVGARWAELGPLKAGIAEHPWLGSGFGKEITYYSPDPFWRDISPDGKVTTTVFEWGYLDFVLKFGYLGAFALIAAFLSLLARLLVRARETGGILELTLLASYVALLVTHIFTPYLNHPIGFGMLLMIEALSVRKDFANT